MITHARARAWIHLGEGALDSRQAKQLTSHLSGCRACRDYADLQEQLAPAITHQMHTRWDARIENYRPTAVPARSRSKTMSFKRVFTTAAAGLVVVAAILGGSTLLRRSLPSALTQQTLPFSTPAGITLPAASPDPSGEISDLPLQLDPAVCVDQTRPAPEGVNLPYPASRVIGGGNVQNGDFTFYLWLYCDEKLSPQDMDHFSDLGGLGVYVRWNYSGPKIEGNFWDMVGVEPDVRMVTGSPMLSNSGASMGMGLQLPDEPAVQWEVSELVRSGEPIRFVSKVQSIDGIYGAELVFRLIAGKAGYIPEEIEVQALPVEAISATSPIEIPENQKYPLVESPISRYPAANGLIAVSSGSSVEGGQLDIFTLQVDGSGLTNLTGNPAADTYPVWSPDGSQVAFLSDRRSAGIYDIYVMNADGTQVIPVFLSPYPILDLDDQGRKVLPSMLWLGWSPDGQYILAEAQAADREENCLVLARADGTDSTCFNNLAFEAPQWSPDGKYISYIKSAGGGGIARLDVHALFTEDNRQESWIYLLPNWMPEGQAQWSPDSQSVASIVVNEATQEAALWVGPASGGFGKNIASLGSAYTKAPSGSPASDILPAWSPDGQYLAFYQPGLLRAAAPDGSQLIDLLAVDDLRSLKWSPDGLYILFTTDEGEAARAHILDVTAALASPGQVASVPLTLDPALHPWFFDWQLVLAASSQGTIPSDPTSILDAKLSLEDIRQIAGYEVAIPAWIPDHLASSDASFVEAGEIVRIFYQYVETNGLVFRQQPVSTNNICELCGMNVPESAIQEISIGGVHGEYGEGVWKLTEDGRVWEPDPYLKTLRWQSEGMAFELLYMGPPDTLSKEEMIAIAESVQVITP